MHTFQFCVASTLFFNGDIYKHEIVQDELWPLYFWLLFSICTYRRQVKEESQPQLLISRLSISLRNTSNCYQMQMTNVVSLLISFIYDTTY